MTDTEILCVKCGKPLELGDDYFIEDVYLVTYLGEVQVSVGEYDEDGKLLAYEAFKNGKGEILTEAQKEKTGTRIVDIDNNPVKLSELSHDEPCEGESKEFRNTRREKENLPIKIFVGEQG